MIYRGWLQLQNFSRLAAVSGFPALGFGYRISRAWHWLHVFPCLALVTGFPTLGTGYMCSRAWHWLHVFPRLALVTCFPVLGTGYRFSRGWHWLHVFPRLAPVTWLRAFATDFTILFGVLPITPFYCLPSYCLLPPSRLAGCFVVFSFQLAPVFHCFLVIHSLQTSDESDDLGESAQDKKPEVTRRTDQPEAGSSRVDKPPLRRYELFLMSLKDISSLPSNFSILS